MSTQLLSDERVVHYRVLAVIIDSEGVDEADREIAEVIARYPYSASLSWTSRQKLD